MAIGEDRVQVAKYESTAGGGSDLDSGVYGNSDPINPQQDAIESAGGYINDAANRDESVGWHRQDGKFYRFDADHPYPGIPIGSGSDDMFSRLILTTEGGLVYAESETPGEVDLVIQE